MTRRKRPGDLQLAILRVLWQQAEARVAEVHAALQPERGLALTTIATMLRKMEARGLCSHRLDGRQFVYRAEVREDQVQDDVVRDALDGAFAGDASALVNHLLRVSDFDPEDLDALKKMIAAKERELGGSKDA